MKIQAVIGKIKSNTFIVDNGGTVLIIDAGAPIKKVLAALDCRKPNAILLTHEHWDHVFYLEDYKKTFNCPVYNTEKEPIIKENKIKIGNTEIQPLLCPGHSPHSIVYKIGADLFTGDVLFHNGIGRTDFMPDGDELMQSTLKKLLDVKFETSWHGHYHESTYAEQTENIKRFIK